MAKVNGDLVVQGSHLNLKLEKLSAAPTGEGLVESRLWYDATAKLLNLYNGESVLEIGAGVTQEALETALSPYAETGDVTSAITAAVSGLAATTDVQNRIDNALAGLDFQADVLGLESDYTNVAGRYIYVDGSNFTTGAAAAVGDIVEVNASGEITSVAYDVSEAGPGALAWNRADSKFFRWNGSDWSEFGGLVGVTAGNGLQKDGDTISVKAADATIVVDANGVKVGDLSGTYVTPAALTTATADFVTDADLSGYVTTEALGTATANFITEDDIAPVAQIVNNLQVQIAASFFNYTSNGTSATSHTITHNLNHRYPMVQVIDPATNQLVMPDSITFTDENSLVVALSVAAPIIASLSWVKTGGA